MNIKGLDRMSSEALWGDGTRLPEIDLNDFTVYEKSFRVKCEHFFHGNQSLESYDLDVSFSLELYFDILDLTNFSLRQAADNSIWNRLAVQVVPDFVVKRWPPLGGIYPKDHFWAKPQRNWLKSLWWYVHLSLQHTNGTSNRDETKITLLNGSTDSIQAIVERPGPGGFRVDFCREVMGRLGKHEIDVNKLKKIMKLNTAKVCLVEPALYGGGVVGYVDSLIAALS
jgi:hypothetical protein